MTPSTLKGQKSLFSVAFIIVAAVFGYYLFAGNLYPVAGVDDAIITRDQFNKEFNTAFHAAQSYKVEGQDLNSSAFSRSLQRFVLDGLVDDTLVRQELIKRMGEEGMNIAVEKEIASATTTASIQKAVQELYGLTLEEFKTMVLVPGAEKQILAEQLQSASTTLEGWLAQRRKEATVNVFLPGFAWEDAQVVLKDSALPIPSFLSSSTESTSTVSGQ